MPPIVAAFFALQLLHVPNLAKSVVSGVDPSARPKGMDPTPITYTVTTAPWLDRRADKRGGCDFQLLVRTTGRGPVRVRINDIEQVLDESWAPRFRIKGGERARFKVEFLEPIGPDAGSWIVEPIHETFTCRPRDSRPAFRGADLSEVPL